MIATKRFEDIAVGDSATVVRRITAKEVEQFVALTGDDNPLHVNPSYAATTPFKEVVVHGMLGASFVSTVIGTQLPGTGALWISQSFEFLNPVRLGDELSVSATVIKKYDRDRLLDLDVRAMNQDRTVVLQGQGRVRLLPASEPKAEVASHGAIKVAIVTGASGGIGRAICRRLARDGYKIIGQYHSGEERAVRLRDEIRSKGGEMEVACVDFNLPDAAGTLAHTALRRFGALDTIVHNASPRIIACSIDDLPWQDLDAQLRAQVGSALSLVRSALPELRQRGYGRIAFVTTQAIDAVPTPRWTAYLAAKSALASFARSVAVELGPHGITVNCVAPGMTDTAMIANIPEKARLMLARQVPVRRLAEPEDVAEAIAFVVSPAAGYVTGETVRVNGGQVMV